MVEEFGRPYDEFKIDMEVDGDGEVMIDKMRIGQVVNNLLSNAIKYSGDLKEIKVKAFRDSNNMIFSVQDHGLGISKEMQEHIFERFFRAPGPSSGRIPGLGLGLYISAQIVKQHGGSLRVSSNPGDGATFEVTLPIFNR